MDWKPFLRQLFLCTGPWSLYFMQGLCMGLPTVLVPQLRKSNQTVTMEQSSWLTSFHTYCGIPWAIILSILVVAIGRKKCYISVCFSTVIGFTIFYFSPDVNTFFIGQIFQGALSAACMATNIILLTECISAKYRGLFLTIKSATFFWGVLAANCIGTFFHWQYIVILGLLCGLYTLLNVIIWPESPLWLATRGRFAECSAAHRWLKGQDEDSEKELNELIKSHENRRFVKQQWNLRYLFAKISSKQFIKPILLSNLMTCLYCFSGKLICTVYALDILKNIAKDEATAYSGMLILDGITVASMYLGCILSKFVRRRVLLIGFTVVGITIMICISIYLYLAKLLVIEENIYISIFLLAAYSITISCGPMIMSTTIIGELIPIESRILSLCIVVLAFNATNATFAKLSPLCFNYFGMHGTFALFALLSIIFLIIIYIYVPETKDKSLHEIAACLKGKEKEIVEENNELININSKIHNIHNENNIRTSFKT